LGYLNVMIHISYYQNAWNNILKVYMTSLTINEGEILEH
jgi:hypothetical protein